VSFCGSHRDMSVHGCADGSPEVTEEFVISEGEWQAGLKE